MSIFKSTLKPFVVRQINTRQKLLSEVNRPSIFSQYVSGKMPWVKMTSFVDYEGSPNLSKQYVLLGGTLYENNEDYFLRSGVNTKGAAYGSELGTRQYGIRPMPGITNIKTRSLAAYGSLTEATIKFYAWDKKQLEDLSILFMRPGYQVLLEWGWSLYLDTFKQGDKFSDRSASNQLNESTADYRLEGSTLSTVDCFSPNQTQDSIYKQLENLRVKQSGNYDGVLGYVKNFEFVLMPNGGYECTTVLISIGDVIDSIRINNLTSDVVNAVSVATPVSGSNPELKTQFEKLMDQYASLDSASSRIGSELITKIDSSIKPNDLYKIDKVIYKYETVTGLAGFNTVSPMIYNRKSAGDRRQYSYIQFAYFIHVLNTFKNIYGKSNQTLFDIEIPPLPTDRTSISNGLCQASYNTVSIDPSICMIKNTQATIFSTGARKGFDPPLVSLEYAFPGNLREYLYPNTNLGVIGNVYVNIGKIVDIYKNQMRANNGYVYLGQFISEILSNLSFALGSVNDFDKYVNDNKVVIIDKHYVELPDEANFDSKYKINVSGNNTIVRNHKIMSKIFPSQSTMIAIAAQNRENISAIQTSTYNYLNKGLSSRIFTDLKDNFDDKDERAKNTEIFNRNMQVLIDYVNQYVLKGENTGTTAEMARDSASAMNAYLNSLIVQIERGTDYKAVIPISVELTVDGISGLTIGEIFTLNKDVLPKDYDSKKVGFIVTGISNEVNNNSWTTTVTSMLCLLDQLSRQKEAKEISDVILQGLAEKIASDAALLNSSIKIFNILAAASVDMIEGRYNVAGTNLSVGGRSVVGNFNPNNPISITKKGSYTNIAVSTFSVKGIDFDTVVKDIGNAYNTKYPQANFQEFFRLNNLSDPDVLVNIIQSTGLYISMEPRIKALFSEKLGKLLVSIKNKQVPEDTGFYSFDLINPMNAVSETGLLIEPVKFMRGYKITKPIGIGITLTPSQK